MPCDLPTTQLAACESGIGKLDSPIELLKIIAQLSCEIADAGGGAATSPGAPLNSVQFNNAGAFGGSADLTFNDATNVLALTGSETIAVGANTTALAISGYSLTGANAQGIVTLAGTWNTTGTPTAIDLNITETAVNAAALILNLRINTTSRFSVSRLGAVVAGSYTLGASAFIIWSTRSVLSSPANGNLTLFNSSFNDWGLLQFGGTAATFPALKRSTTTLQVRLADDSAFASLSVLNILTNNAAALVTSSVALTDFAGAGAGTITNAPTAGNPTKWIAIVDNGTTRFIPTWT